MSKISQKRIDFEDGETALDTHAIELLEAVSQVLISYPEIDVVIQAYRGNFGKEKDSPLDLVRLRAEAIRACLLDEAVASSVTIAAPNAAQETSTFGMAKLVTQPPNEVTLLDPQRRLEFILQRRPFSFMTRKPFLDALGVKVAAYCVQVLAEAPQSTIVITLPMKSSQMALNRAQSIRQAFLDGGCGSEVEVKVATFEQDTATIVIEGAIAATAERIPALQDKKDKEIKPSAEKTEPSRVEESNNAIEEPKQKKTEVVKAEEIKAEEVKAEEAPAKRMEPQAQEKPVQEEPNPVQEEVKPAMPKLPVDTRPMQAPAADEEPSPPPTENLKRAPVAVAVAAEAPVLVPPLASRDDEPRDMEGQLNKILKETPVIFSQGQSSVTWDSLPVVWRCGDLLKEVRSEYLMIRIEVHTSSSSALKLGELRARNLAQRRANHVMELLRLHGCQATMSPKGYAYPRQIPFGSSANLPLLWITVMNSIPDCMIKLDDISCVQGHNCKIFLTPNDEFRCNSCRSRQPFRVPVYGCRQCDYDLCMRCTNEEIANREKQAEEFVKEVYEVDNMSVLGCNSRGCIMR